MKHEKEIQLAVLREENRIHEPLWKISKDSKHMSDDDYAHELEAFYNRVQVWVDLRDVDNYSEFVQRLSQKLFIPQVKEDEEGQHYSAQGHVLFAIRKVAKKPVNIKQTKFKRKNSLYLYDYSKGEYNFKKYIPKKEGTADDIYIRKQRVGRYGTVIHMAVSKKTGHFIGRVKL